ncbi:uncharacterized protein LOC111006625 isoform X2 [Momordica charantia]|uniref:Uncharacterized protein LOC111006625 isoform X2 n=1 Tax=Momordica charantia TaxID=3673 RepID=A0A6J1BY28_MOMCH|nr:uncharacterized protein LOC111006625 isoform X2 [Momordica charantia]
MHAIRGGWTGRPLALAKHNESEGRKTRIRRSKEERKAMVEVFIKKYQESNNGSFPSLNLTHKEVGGSFYMVREIVRDIIQENRVLGPGKLLLEEHNFDHSLEENPLHSIAIEPQSHLPLSSEEFDFRVKYNQCINEEPILVSDEQCTSTNIQISHNGPIINGSLVDVSDKDSDKLIESELLVNEDKEVEEVVKEESGMPITHVTPLAADVVVETFPLSPISGAANSSVEKAEENFVSSLSVAKFDSMEVAPIVESSNGSILKEGGVHEVEGPQLEVRTDTPTAAAFEQCQKTSEKAPNASPSGTQNHNKTFSNGIDQASKIKEETQIENKVDAQQDSGSQKQTIPTLNRINLESWEEMSKNPSNPESNPLLEILKAFVSAFVKFWSE